MSGFGGSYFKHTGNFRGLDEESMYPRTHEEPVMHRCKTCGDRIWEGELCDDCERLETEISCVWSTSSTDDRGIRGLPKNCIGKDCRDCKDYIKRRD